MLLPRPRAFDIEQAFRNQHAFFWHKHLSLANETKRLYSFVARFLTKRWFCDDLANQTEQPPRDLCRQVLQGRVFRGLCAPVIATGATASPSAAFAAA